MKNRPSCIFHIGTEKTGTSSIQRMMSSNRALLNELGFLYPLSLGKLNHTNLVAYALDDLKSDDSMRRRAFKDQAVTSVRQFRDKTDRKLSRELKRFKGHTVVLSNEHCQSRLIRDDEIERVNNLLRRYFFDIKVLVYLRRQDRLSVSSYSTALRNGAILERPNLPNKGSEGPYQYSFYDYQGLIDRYERHFGYGKVNVRLFDPQRLRGGDVINDFLYEIGLTDIGGMNTNFKENETLGNMGLHFLLEFNKYVQTVDSPSTERVRNIITYHFVKHGGSSFPLISEDEARNFVRQFEEGNEIIRKRFFPKSASLFSEDYSMYEVDLRSAQPDFGTAIRECIRILVDNLGKV